MKKFYVIGNPISHSLSPKIHNYWFKKNNIQATYFKKDYTEDKLDYFINKIRSGEIAGANITVPFKKKIIPLLDKLTDEATRSNSVNTVFLKKDEVIGHNTDIAGFYLSLNEKKLEFKNKNAIILGSGGVAPSIILALKQLGIGNIIISNRTKEKAINLKKIFNFLEILDWEKTVRSNFVINATSLGLNKNDKIKLDFKMFNSDTLFYDVIYNPTETNFLKEANNHGYKTQNGLMMFIHQAAESFRTWNNVEAEIDKNLINFIKND